MQKIVKKLTVEGGFFDCLLYKDYLYLWNVEGEQHVYNWAELYERRNDFDSHDVSSAELERYLLKKQDIPGKSLPIDTNLLEGKLYVATEDGLYKSDAYNTYEARRYANKAAHKIWDARLFSINRHPESPLLALSAGDDGLYELNESAYTTNNLAEEEKNIFRVNNAPSHQSEYWDASIGSESRGNQYVAKFLQSRAQKGQSSRNFIGIEEVGPAFTMSSLMSNNAAETELGDVVQTSHWKDWEVIEFDDGLNIISKGRLLLSVKEPVVKWRIYSVKGGVIVIILLDTKIEVYQNVIKADEKYDKESYDDDFIVQYAKDIIRNLSAEFPERINIVNMAELFLKKYIARLKGVNNIDFVDANDWDRMTEVQVDCSNQIIYIIKEWPRRFKDQEDELMHRMVWGVDDCFVMAFKFGELKLYKDYAYPFVSLKGKRVSTSKQRFVLTKKFGDIVAQFHHPFCNEYRIKGEAFVYNVSFYHTDAVCALMMGKDTGWGAVSSARLLPLLTLDAYKTRLHDGMKQMARLLLSNMNEPSFIACSTTVKKALAKIKRRVIEMMRLELECRKRDTYDYDEKECYDFGALKEDDIFEELAAIVDEERFNLLKQLHDLTAGLLPDIQNYDKAIANYCRLAEEYRIALTSELSNGRYRRNI